MISGQVFLFLEKFEDKGESDSNRTSDPARSAAEGVGRRETKASARAKAKAAKLRLDGGVEKRRNKTLPTDRGRGGGGGLSPALDEEGEGLCLVAFPAPGASFMKERSRYRDIPEINNIALFY